MGCPQTDGRDVNMCVAAGSRSPWSCKLAGDATRLCRQCFDGHMGDSLLQTDVVADDPEATHSILDDPEGEECLQPRNLRKVINLEMQIYSDDGNSHHDAMSIEKGLVEGMA